MSVPVCGVSIRCFEKLLMKLVKMNFHLCRTELWEGCCFDCRAERCVLQTAVLIGCLWDQQGNYHWHSQSPHSFCMLFSQYLHMCVSVVKGKPGWTLFQCLFVGVSKVLSTSLVSVLWNCLESVKPEILRVVLQLYSDLRTHLFTLTFI